MIRDTFLAMDRDTVIKSKPVDPAADTLAHARGKGWEPHPDSPGMMVHPDLPGHSLHVTDDGKWAHMGAPAGNGPRMHEVGAGAEDIKRHLKTLHSGFARLRKQRPPNPRTIEIDGDQDSIACVSESTDPASSFRVGNVYPDQATSEPLFSPVGKRNKYRTHGGLYAAKNTANFGGKKAPLFTPEKGLGNLGDKKAPPFKSAGPRVA